MKLRFRIPLALAALLGAGACEVFNESCPVTTPEVWGRGLPVDLDIREVFVRQCEAPVGNFLADALRLYPYDIKDAGADIQLLLALINGGAIRDEVVCGEADSSRERIPQGPITNQDIYQLLPFYEDAVVLVKLQGSQLKRVLERSVSSLNLPGDLGQEGHFLQVSGQRGIEISVDCQAQSQWLSSDGLSISTPGERITHMCYGSDPCATIEPNASYYLATLDYLVGTDDQGVPNDGFVGFHYVAAGEEPIRVIKTYVPVIEVVRHWLVEYEDAIATEYPDLEIYPAVQGRLPYDNCTQLESLCQAPAP